MKRIGTAGILALALTVGGCSAQQGHQNQSQASNVAPIEPEAAPEAEATPKPITAAELLAQQPAEIQAAFKDARSERRVGNVQDSAVRALSLQPGTRSDSRLRAIANDRPAITSG